MRHHDDQTVFGDVAQQPHDLGGGHGIQGAGWLISQQDFRVVDQRPGDCDALHLPAGKLGGSLVDVFGKPHLIQSRERAGPPLSFRNSRKRECQLDVAKDALVRDQVVALEDKTDAVVSVGVPVTIGVLGGVDPINNERARIIAIQAADNVEHCGFATTGWAEYRHELVVSEGNGDII